MKSVTFNFISNVYKRIYDRSAGKPESLPWATECVPELLDHVVAARKNLGRVLDIGCGTGVCSAYLARKGYQVTALDFVPQAVEMAKERFKRMGVSVNAIKADMFEWQADGKYDLILDVGCLHSFSGDTRSAYKQRLLTWLAPDADYLLVQFGRRHFLDRWPIGPFRYSRAEVNAFFAPDLKEMDYRCKKRAHPMPLGRLLTGPSYLESSYWFKPV